MLTLPTNGQSVLISFKERQTNLATVRVNAGESNDKQGVLIKTCDFLNIAGGDFEYDYS